MTIPYCYQMRGHLWWVSQILFGETQDTWDFLIGECSYFRNVLINKCNIRKLKYIDKDNMEYLDKVKSTMTADDLDSVIRFINILPVVIVGLIWELLLIKEHDIYKR